MEINLEEPTRPQLAALLGCTSRWIGELRSRGEMPSDGASWAENLEAWIARSFPESEGGEGLLNLDAERARLAKEQADRLSAMNAVSRRELASLPDMTLAVTGVITLAVSRLRMVPQIVAKGDEALRQKIDIAISDALDDLSVTRVEEALGGGFEDGEDPDGGDE